MRKQKSGTRAGAGKQDPRSFFKAALLVLLLLILVFLIWVYACVPPMEQPEGQPPAVEIPAESETPALLGLPMFFYRQPAEPEPAADNLTPVPEPLEAKETPEPEGRTAVSVLTESDSTGTRSIALKKGMLGVLTYKKKSVGIWPDIREDTLLKGPGWVPESALPGEGMAVIFGHRNRNHLLLIKKIREGDTLTFMYADGRTLTYRVRSVQIFETTSQWRLPTENGDVLVIATCYPFQYTGSAPGKFQVIADRIG